MVVHSIAANQEPPCLLTQLLTMTTTQKFPSLVGVVVGVVGQVEQTVAGGVHPAVPVRAKVLNKQLILFHRIIKFYISIFKLRSNEQK